MRSLLGEPSQVRRDLALAGNLARWRGLDGFPGGLPPADEPLRLDPFLCGWLLGDRSALHHDPRVRRSLRLRPGEVRVCSTVRKIATMRPS